MGSHWYLSFKAFWFSSFVRVSTDPFRRAFSRLSFRLSLRTASSKIAVGVFALFISLSSAVSYAQTQLSDAQKAAVITVVNQLLLDGPREPIPEPTGERVDLVVV
ncbi:MAG: hypothetical protein P8I38_08235 [Arenicella sp.]|nr:hypothetical protein [Arenicella sp.]